VRPISDPRAWDTARLVRAGSAVAVGGFGWLLAHVVTFWFVAHSHHGAMSVSARHVHSYTAAAAAVAGGLAVAALLAIALTCGWGRDRSSGPTRRRPVHRAVGLSTAAFLIADAVEHTVLGMEHTSPALVLLGACLHALFGAGSSLLWLGFVDGVQSLFTPVRSPATVLRVRRTSPGRRPWRARRLLWTYAVAGRAPPMR
jgi:hypothetical protein